MPVKKMSELKLKIGNREVFFIIVALIAIFLFALFRVMGLRILFAFLTLTFPLYLIINNFEFDLSEKIIFSVYSSIGIFPTITYFLGLAVGNLALAIAITFLLLLGIGLAINKLKKKG